MIYLLRAIWCHFTRGHQYGAWEYSDDTPSGRRVYLRACKHCGWVVTQRDRIPGR